VYDRDGVGSGVIAWYRCGIETGLCTNKDNKIEGRHGKLATMHISPS
jgi:hypothetical protein